MSERQQSEFQEKVIQVDRISRVVKGGKRMRFRALVSVGDQRGRIGVGIGKAQEVALAVQKAVSDAKKKLIAIPIIDDTIPHEGNFKFGTSRVLIFPAAPGTGIIAGGAARAVIEVSGIKNILSKTYGSNNRMNVAMATFFALKQLTKKEERQRELGKIVEKVEKEEKKEEKSAAARPKEKKGATKKSAKKSKAGKK